MEENKTNAHLYMYKCQVDENAYGYVGVVADSIEQADACEGLNQFREKSTLAPAIDFNQLNILELFPIVLADPTKSYNLGFGYRLEETDPNNIPKPEADEVPSEG